MQLLLQQTCQPGCLSKVWKPDCIKKTCFFLNSLVSPSVKIFFQARSISITNIFSSPSYPPPPCYPPPPSFPPSCHMWQLHLQHGPSFSGLNYYGNIHRQMVKDFIGILIPPSASDNRNTISTKSRQKSVEFWVDVARYKLSSLPTSNVSSSFS